MVNVGTGKSGSRFLKREWPVVEGLTAGTTKQEGRITELEVEEIDLRSESDKVGIG